MEVECLTEETLVYLGIYDETYDLYYNLLQVYTLAYNGYYEVNREESLLWPQKLDALSRKECRKLIEEYLKLYSHIFSNEYPRYHTNASNMAAFSMLNVSCNRLEMTCRPITFRFFLKELSNLIVRIVFMRTHHDKPNISEQFIREQINKNVTTELLKAEQQRFKKTKNDFVPISSELIVFHSLSLISCNHKKHKVIPKMYTADLVNKSVPITIPVHYCETCGRCFVGERTLSIYEKMFGKIFVKLSYEEVRTHNGKAFSNFSDESLLHRLGYNVIEGKFTEHERRELLVYFLEHQKISYFEMCRDLENAIRIFQNVETHKNAVEKWTSDLSYICEYMLNKQSV